MTPSHLKIGKSATLTVFAFILAVGGVFYWLFTPFQPAQGQVYAATKAIRPATAIFAEPYNEGMARTIFEQDADVEALLSAIEHDFIQAVPLAHGEAGNWREAGCWEETCAHIMLYNFSEGGTVEGVVNLQREAVLDLWTNREARPLASTHTLRSAAAIAAQDKRVRDVLGSVTTEDMMGDLMMVPMNIWLLDDACNTDWCVDLTYHDPAASGRIFHVTVNLQENRVARTFYTRGRETIPYRDITPQRDAYTDGCHEQAGWEVCWQMTAHDGIEFYDGKFEGRSVFSSIKIPQVEVWYPSWPGGYRDEIGFQASVPPYFDTRVEDIEGGFQISQLFTEFTRWPNCICCYRYDEGLALFEDGSFETRFVSHGPGCDDLSIYQPMWRIDLDLKDPNRDSVWVWREDQWVEQQEEGEIELIFDNDLSPDDTKIATFNLESDGSEDMHYHWSYHGQDPLGVDEAKMFFVTGAKGEGELPVLTGAANTFQPPRQWINGDRFSGSNVTLWYVPLLKTKKNGPWYCMPEPAPDGTPCTAVLRAQPGGPLPTEDELAALIATRDEEATESGVDQQNSSDAEQPAVTPLASPIPTLAPTTTPIKMEGEDAETLLIHSGCGSCHVIGPLGEEGKVGPSLSNIGAIAVDRGEALGYSASEYIRRSILYPNEHIVPECPNGPCLDHVMPDYYGERMSADQLEMVVAYLMAQGGDENGYGASAGRTTPIAAAVELGERVTGEEEEGAGGRSSASGIANWIMLIIAILGGLVFLGVLVGPRLSANLTQFYGAGNGISPQPDAESSPDAPAPADSPEAEES